MMLVVMLIQKNLNPPPQDKLQKDIAFWMPYFFAFNGIGVAVVSSTELRHSRMTAMTGSKLARRSSC